MASVYVKCAINQAFVKWVYAFLIQQTKSFKLLEDYTSLSIQWNTLDPQQYTTMDYLKLNRFITTTFAITCLKFTKAHYLLIAKICSYDRQDVSDIPW